MPWITNVHDEYDAIATKVATGGTDFIAETASLQAKLAVTYQKMDEKIAQAAPRPTSSRPSRDEGLGVRPRPPHRLGAPPPP